MSEPIELKLKQENFILFWKKIPAPHLLLKVINYVDMIMILEFVVGMAYMGTRLTIYLLENDKLELEENWSPKEITENEKEEDKRRTNMLVSFIFYLVHLCLCAISLCVYEVMVGS